MLLFVLGVWLLFGFDWLIEFKWLLIMMILFVFFVLGMVIIIDDWEKLWLKYLIVILLWLLVICC